jgi:hypothetical protein
MPRIETRILIEAPPSTVWNILTDFAKMPEWNPFIQAISGPLKLGEHLSVKIAPPGQQGMVFKPTVLAATPEKEFRWRGTIIGRWLFAGEHYFVIEELGPRRTSLTHGEQFSGLLAPLLMRGSTLSATGQGFVAMNEALKQRAESALLAQD